MKRNSLIHKLIHNCFYWLYGPIREYPQKIKAKRKHRLDKERLEKIYNSCQKERRIFYLGTTNHNNLGDNAQFYCIRKWINKNFPNYPCHEFESDSILDKNFGFLDLFIKTYKENDLIIFQSGYTTQDLGGNHDEMHRKICELLPNAHILMMPQTIFFREDKNRLRTSNSLNKAKNMLFLARDKNSFDQAKEMFPNIKVECYPDIVTTLIGKYYFENDRNGVCLCVRNDGEKYYTDKELKSLSNRLERDGDLVTWTDTSIKKSAKQIHAKFKDFIDNEIKSFSRYNVTITDRYHGTIFSLCAGTPVIILKTTDHKVTSGAEWFNGIYDEHVYVASSLNEAYEIWQKIKRKSISHKMQDYFEIEYYDKLKGLLSY